MEEKMTVILSIPSEMEQKLRERAAQAGQSVEGYIQQLVERDVLSTNGGQAVPQLSGQPSTLHPGMTLDEILAPVREEFERSGMTDEELGSLVEEIREEIWQEKQARKGP
jgi:plasmid stability protein